MKDFFYVCRQHLKDSGFAEAIEPEAFVQLRQQDKTLSEEILKLRRELLQAEKYSWKVLGSWAGFGTQKGQKHDAGESADDGTIAAKHEETESTDTAKSSGKKERSPETIKRNIRELEEEKSHIERQIANFEFKKFALNKDIYSMRRKNHNQAKAKAQRQKAMQQPGFFPSAPTAAIKENQPSS